MRLRLRTVADGRVVDVTVDVDPASTIGEVADALFPDAGPPGRAAGSLALRVVDGDRARIVPATITVDGSGLRSGAVVGPAAASIARPTGSVAAVLVVHDGPDAPREFPLRPGWNTIGRAHDRDVRLAGPLVSNRHGRVHVGQSVEIVDDGSANGIRRSGTTVTRAVIRASDRLDIGGTVCSIVRLADPNPSSAVAFNRPPRVDPTYCGERLRAPEPPRPPAPQRFPLATALAPVALALVLYAVTQSVLMILFFAVSPILVVGSWWETRSASRRQLAAETARFRAALDDLERRLGHAVELETMGRRAEHPSPVEVLEAVEERSALLWTRRPEHASFGTVRLGLGRLPSRTEVEMPAANDTLPELWAELCATVARFAHVDGVPVVADLRHVGNLGISGAEVAAEPVLRAVLAQLVGLHAPGDLQLVGIGPFDTWDWMKWLPHTDQARLAGDATEADAVTAELERIVRDRSEQPADGQPPLPLVVGVVHDEAYATRARLVQIAEQGPAVGVHLVWYAPTTRRLPAACRAFVDVGAGTARIGDVTTGAVVGDVDADRVGASAVERFAMRLSPVVDAGAAVDVAAELPRDVALVDLLDDDVATTPSAVERRWSEHSNGGLRAVVGAGVHGPMVLDLRAQGPHALVGGTTGSGKSEFLQTWILAMAADHSPDRVNFLLVDYKGGAAFADCVHLPHCVGLVTDLRPHLVRRALVSLDAELRRRERQFHERGAKDLAELERTCPADAPPSLVIVIDEFAALVAEVPEFVDGVVNVAQRGRSLGLHLVLATQRPAGVVSDDLRANANLRVALRMADAADAHDVIGTAEAASFDQDVPGRAIVSAGAGRSITFQAAYSGGHAVGRSRHRPVSVAPLRFGRASGANRRTDRGVSGAGATDIERIVETVRAAAQRSGLAAPRRPWLPELAERYRLELLPTLRRDDAIVFGVADDPERQCQPTVAFHPDRDGNMAIYGTGGSGKTTALRTLALGAAIGAARGGRTWVYALDFAAHGLRPLEAMPHVGGVVAGDDRERVERLLRFLEHELDERAVRFAASSSAGIVEHRRRSGSDEARILVLVDGVGAFRGEYEGGARHRWWERFERLVAEGRALGVHVVMAADRPAAVSAGLASAVQCNLVLRLANELDAEMLGGPTEPGDAPPGRGRFDGRTVQVAAAGGATDLGTQRRAIEQCAAAMRRRGIPDAPPIGVMPTRVLLDELAAVGDRPVIGIDADTLGPAALPHGDGFLVAGGPQSGVSTTTATVVRALGRHDPGREFVLLGVHGSRLAQAAPWAASARGATEVAALAERLSARLPLTAGGSLVVVVEAIGDLLDTEAEAPVHELLRRCRQHGVYVVADGEPAVLAGSWPLLRLVKTYRCGIVLEPDQMDGEALFKVPFPRIERAEFPLGRALLVHGGSVDKVQVALPG